MTELSGLEVLALTKEIDSALHDSYINNIFRIGGAQIIRFRGSGGNDLWLIASPIVGVWLSERVAEREETNEFTTSLRRLLGRARFKGARQVDLDRIFQIELEGAAPVSLVVELMPPGNLIVTGQDGRILAIMDEVRSPRRRLVRGGTYEPPKPRRLSPEAVRAEDVRSMAESEKTAGQAIGRHVSLPRKYVLEALGRMGLDEGSPSSTLLGREREAAAVLEKMVDEAANSPSPCIVESDGVEEILVIRPTKARPIREGVSLSSICDALLLDRVLAVAPSQMPESERHELELAARIGKLEEEARSYEAQAATARALAASASISSSVASALDAIGALGLKVRKAPGSPEGVASLAFDRAKELDVKAAEVLRAAKKLRARGPEPGARGSRRRALPKRDRQWYEKFRWFRTSEGRLAIGGRDASSNAMLVRRHMEADDSVYHASLFGSPFFILKGGKDQTDAEIREVAQATVSFSSAWKTGLGSAEAFWVTPDQVKSAAPSGEFLARGSFAIVGKKNQVSRNVVEIAVGMTETGELTGAPESAFKGRSTAYVVLRPHREKASETAKRVLNDLGSMADDLKGYTVDDVLRVLPAGGGKVVRKYGPPGRDPGA